MERTLSCTTVPTENDNDNEKISDMFEKIGL